MKASLTLLAAAAIAFAQISCVADDGKSKKDLKSEEAKPKPEAPKLVGRIASVPQDKRFVLIQSYGKWSTSAGTILTTRGPENRSANLLATGETLGEFAAADLQSGLVEVGDAVYSRHIPKPLMTSDASETPEIQQNPNLSNVKKNN